MNRTELKLIAKETLQRVGKLLGTIRAHEEAATRAARHASEAAFPRQGVTAIRRRNLHETQIELNSIRLGQIETLADQLADATGMDPDEAQAITDRAEERRLKTLRAKHLEDEAHSKAL